MVITWEAPPNPGDIDRLEIVECCDIEILSYARGRLVAGEVKVRNCGSLRVIVIQMFTARRGERTPRVGPRAATFPYITRRSW